MGHKSKLIGLISNLHDSFIEEIFMGVNDVADESWAYFLGRGIRGAKGPAWQHIDGMVLACPHSELFNEFIDSVQTPHIVNIFSHHIDTGVPTVCTDEYAIGELAAIYFLELGLTSFAFENMNDNSPASVMRRKGFADVLKKNGYSHRFFRDENPDCSELSDERQYQLYLNWLASLQRPCGLLAHTNHIGETVCAHCSGIGLNVPEDIAVLGIGNDRFETQICRPPLSSIDCNYYNLGRKAGELLRCMMNAEAPPTEPFLIAPTGIVSRKSTELLAFDDPDMEKAMAFMREYACEACTIGDIIDHISISRRTFEKRFNDTFQISPHEMLTRIRINRAKLLLRTTDLSVNAISEQCGYSVYKYFYEIFRKQAGESPGIFRKNAVRLNF